MQPVPMILYHQSVTRTSSVFWRIDHLVQTFPLHTHDFFEIELITAGSGRNWINNICVPLQPGSIYLITPSDLHRVEVDTPMTLQCIRFLPEFLHTAELQSIREAHFAQFDAESFARMLTLSESIRDEMGEEAPYARQSTTASLTLLLVQLLRVGTRCAPAASSARMRLALEIIQKNCANPDLRLKTVADACELSTCHFSTRFHKVVGCSFSEYLTSCRLNRACALLTDPNMSVTEAAFDSGFSSLSNFFRVFRSAYQCTPLEYRQRLTQP